MKIYCLKCQQPADDSLNFCPNCGNRISVDGERLKKKKKPTPTWMWVLLCLGAIYGISGIIKVLKDTKMASLQDELIQKYQVYPKAETYAQQAQIERLKKQIDYQTQGLYPYSVQYEIYPTMPYTDIRDYRKPGYIIEKKK